MKAITQRMKKPAQVDRRGGPIWGDLRGRLPFSISIQKQMTSRRQHKCADDDLAKNMQWKHHRISTIAQINAIANT
jgi:hypothetical protein